MNTSPRPYKRSWKNYLINKPFQLRFSLLLVALTAILMGGLGVWVMHAVRVTTDVGISTVLGERCPEVGAVKAAAPAAPPVQAPPVATGASGRRVQLEEATVTMVAPAVVVPEQWTDQIAAHWACNMRQAATIAALGQGRTKVLVFLLIASAIMIIGMGVYGITLTHKVAGPLFKISLYLNKVTQGRYDTVYPLRKGDQLIAFYDAFRGAHAALVQAQRDDVEALKQVLHAVENAGELAPEEAAAVAQLRRLVAQKEGSLA